MINYLCTSPLPKVKGTDAAYNEIDNLVDNFGGHVNSLYPFSRPSSKYPIKLLGLHKLNKIKEIERNSKINHIYGSGLFNMLITKKLHRPSVYTLLAGINDPKHVPSVKYLCRFDKIVVSNERDLNLLKQLGNKNVVMIRTAIPVDRFTKHRLPFDPSTPRLKILMASAPWESKQFNSKGIHLILSTLQKLDKIHITFLWRGILVNEMKALIQKYNVSEKVSLVNQNVEVNQYLKTHHGMILLSNDSSIVKAYPHSLLESISSGKPIILSQQIPLSDFVIKNNIGVVLRRFDKDALIHAINDFSNNYASIADAAYAIPRSQFSQPRFIKDHDALYKNLLTSDTPKC